VEQCSRLPANRQHVANILSCDDDVKFWTMLAAEKCSVKK
jgi:hypothetical protein